MQSQKVLFVLMPWANLHTPSLGLGILQNVLRRRGVDADCAYLNLGLGERLGFDLYQKAGASNFLEGERLFSPYVFGASANGHPPPLKKRHWVDSLHPRLQASMLSHEQFAHAHEEIYRHLNDCMEAVDWPAYDIIGFSSVFQQNLPSLALARRVKARYPDKIVVMGGANCDGEMGLALHEQFPFLDYVVVGEADDIIGPFVDAVRDGGRVAGLKGVVYRDNGTSVFTGFAPPVANLNTVPMPDSSDYFKTLERTALDIRPKLYFESSRGCWWGEKHLCKFCGLNQLGLAHRAKSPRRVLREIVTLAKRHRTLDLLASDNILPHQYIRELLPSLRRVQERYDIRLGYEIKANLKKEQVADMAAAGITSVQPGIESFSDHVLQLMDKGATGIAQMQTLKWLMEYGVTSINYGVLHSFPMEVAEDYREMHDAMQSLTHLTPPNYTLSVQLHRFSPYFDHPEQYGIRNVRPHRLYHGIYPLDRRVLARIAYLFEFDGAPTDPALVLARSECVRVIEDWQRRHKPNQLMYRRGPTFTTVYDRRFGAEVKHQLHGAERRLYDLCDKVTSGGAAVQALAGTYSEQEVRAALNRMTAARLMYRDAKDRHLSLALPYKGTA